APRLLSLEIRTGITAVRKQNRAFQKRVAFQINGRAKTAFMEIIPLDAPAPFKERYYLILFKEAAPVNEGRGGRKKEKGGGQLAPLKQELSAVKTYLQSIIEEQEGTNEELRAANEEIQSTNEELQSTNE